MAVKDGFAEQDPPAHVAVEEAMALQTLERKRCPIPLSRYRLHQDDVQNEGEAR